MFQATWFWQDIAQDADSSRWTHITTPDALAKWETASSDTSRSDQRQFPDAIHSAGKLCGDFGGGRPIVGYNRGDALTEAKAAGFETTGDLTVWVQKHH